MAEKLYVVLPILGVLCKSVNDETLWRTLFLQGPSRMIYEVDYYIRSTIVTRHAAALSAAHCAYFSWALTPCRCTASEWLWCMGMELRIPESARKMGACIQHICVWEPHNYDSIVSLKCILALDNVLLHQGNAWSFLQSWSGSLTVRGNNHLSKVGKGTD